MESSKGLNPYAAEFFYRPVSYYYCFSNVQTSSTWFLSGTPTYSPPFPTEFPYPTQFEHHVLPAAHQTVPDHQPELVEVEQQSHDPLAHEATQKSVPPRAPRFRGSKGGFRRYSRFFGQKTETSTSAQKQECRPALKSTEKKVPKRFVDYNWRLPRRMVRRFSDVLLVRKDGDGTTVMIRNIPNKYSRDMLMAFLDNHCAKENGNGGVESESAFDFLYLPIDFWTGMNKGYAFVNFTNPEAVWKFYSAVDSQTWDAFQSNKIRKIAYARIQGKEDLIQHFETMGFPCEYEEVLPVCFSPPRDGSEKVVQKRRIGKLGSWEGIGLRGQTTGTWRKVKKSD